MGFVAQDARGRAVRRAYSVGRLSRRAFAGGGVLSAAPDTRDLKIVCVGNSLTVGFGTTYPYPDILSAQLNAGGKTTTVVNAGHNGEGTDQLATRVATEIDTEHDASRACVLVLQEVLNDLAWDSTTAATAYQHVIDYVDALADSGWYVIVLTPTPAQGAGMSGTYETRRQDFLALVAADPTFSGRVDAIVDTGNDPRLADPTNAYWYNADAIHFKDVSNGVVAALAIAAIRSILPAVSGSIAHVPYPCPVLDARSGLQDAGGAAPDDGENVATWVPLVSVEATGNFVQATDANRPSYNLANVAVDLSVDERMSASATTFTSTRYTLAGRVKLTTTGNLMSHIGTAATDVRFYTSEGPGTHSLYAHDGTNGSLKTMPAGTLSDDAWHTFVAVCDATDASHKLYVDGSLVSTSTYLTWNTNPNASGVGTLQIFGTGAGNGVAGKVKALVKSLVPVNATERAALEAALSAL